MTRLQEKYRTEVIPAMMKHFKYKNIMQVPRLVKVVLNIGLGEAITNAKAMEAAENDLTTITGQHPVITRSRKSISVWRLREGMPIGIKVTLRGQRMYQFVDKLMNAALPRVREFQGVPPNSFDGRGNYSLGFKEQTFFPEIEYDKIDKIRGMQICISTNARTDEEGKRLMEFLGMPFSKE